MSTVRNVRVAIIGSGFGGLAAGRALLRDGRDDFVLLERSDDVGGTWRDNDYPGAACDVPSHLYSLSFSKNPGWTRSFPLQPELHAYLRRVAEEEGLLPFVRFGAEVTDAQWDPARRRWNVRTTGGDYSAEVLVTAAGALSDAKLPDVPGITSFRGEMFHSSTWRHDLDLTGKRIAVIGTGASAIQFVPQVQKVAGEVHLFQRSAAWVVPRVDRQLPSFERRLYLRSRTIDKIARGFDYLLRETVMMPAFVIQPRLQKATEVYSKLHLRRQVADPELRRKLTPDYAVGCKRILISNDYYPALAQPNVQVHTTGLASLTPTGVIGADGVEREVDVVIFGTGFQVTDLPIAHRIRDGRGVSLADHWAENGMEALRGSTSAGYPNLFYIVGPNTGLGHSSMIFMIESQANYLRDALRQMDRYDLAVVEPSREVQRDWNAWLQKRLASTIWVTGGCVSWYQDANGRVTQLWPASTLAFRRATKHFRLAEYNWVARSEPLPAAVPEQATVALDDMPLAGATL